MVVPFEPGGSSDALARIVADIYAEKLDREVVVVNKDGAAGAIGVSTVANTSDSNQILFTTKSSMISVPALQDVDYNIDDFELISSLAKQPLTLAVPGKSPFKSMKDLASSDTKLHYGHSGVGAFPDVLQGSLFDAAQVESAGVPFDGNGPAITALVGGQVDSAAAEPSVMNEYVKSGDARYIGVFSKERLAALPKVPTFDELGYDAATIMQDWYLLAPKSLDEASLSDLREAADETVADPQYMSYLKDNVAEPLDIAPDEWAEAMKSEGAEYEELLGRLDVER